MRPAVVWFGEGLPEETWQQAQQLCTRLDCLLVIGTSATVYPAAGLISLAIEHRSRIVVIDPNPGAAGELADIFLQGKASEVVPALLQGLRLSSQD
jgi:NAD-dependent deacetylase